MIEKINVCVTSGWQLQNWETDLFFFLFFFFSQSESQWLKKKNKHIKVRIICSEAMPTWRETWTEK